MHTYKDFGLYFQLTPLHVLKMKNAGELWRGKKKNRNVERMGGGGGQEIRYEEVGGIWVEMEISLPCFPFLLSSPVLSISLSPSTPPLGWLLRVFGGRPGLRSRWPSPEPRSAMEAQGLHAMHYLEVSGFVLAGPAAVNGHHYSFITAGTG